MSQSIQSVTWNLPLSGLKPGPQMACSRAIPLAGSRRVMSSNTPYFLLIFSIFQAYSRPQVRQLIFLSPLVTRMPTHSTEGMRVLSFVRRTRLDAVSLWPWRTKEAMSRTWARRSLRRGHIESRYRATIDCRAGLVHRPRQRTRRPDRPADCRGIEFDPVKSARLGYLMSPLHGNSPPTARPALIGIRATGLDREGATASPAATGISPTSHDRCRHFSRQPASMATMACHDHPFFDTIHTSPASRETPYIVSP